MMIFRKATPFLLVGLCWLVVGSVLCATLGTDRVVSVRWMAGLWLLCSADMVVIAMLVRHVIAFVGTQDAVQKSTRLIHISWWVFLKLICLGLFGVALLAGKGIPFVGLICGLGTMVMVPLLGGLLWSHKESKHARAT